MNTKITHERCERCGEVLNQKNIKWFEHSNTDGNYYNASHLPSGHISQGLFPFGTACATRQLNETIGKLKA
jgi:hypothetical protein